VAETGNGGWKASIMVEDEEHGEEVLTTKRGKRANVGSRKHVYKDDKRAADGRNGGWKASIMVKDEEHGEEVLTTKRGGADYNNPAVRQHMKYRPGGPLCSSRD
jgi:hypothetical protein